MTDTRLQDARTRFDIKPDANTHFAWLRTRMALERTLMAWIRTGVSLIAFGFTIFQFLEKFNAMPGVARPLRPHVADPRSHAPIDPDRDIRVLRRTSTVPIGLNQVSLWK